MVFNIFIQGDIFSITVLTYAPVIYKKNALYSYTRINVQYLQFHNQKSHIMTFKTCHRAILSFNGMEVHAIGALTKNASFSLHVLVCGTIRLYSVLYTALHSRRTNSARLTLMT